MATLEFELKDSNGTDVEIGDIVEVEIPEVEINDRWGDTEYYRPWTKARAKVLLPPSQGLQLKILSVIEEIASLENTNGANDAIRPKQRISFRRTVWKWHKAD